MAQNSKFDWIDYLVNRKFPDARSVRAKASVHSPPVEKKRLEEIKAYQRELRKKSAAELEAFIVAEIEREEQEHFLINQPPTPISITGARPPIGRLMRLSPYHSARRRKL